MATRGSFIDRGRFRVSPVTPFTYRDGLTYLEVLEQLRRRDIELVELINTGLADAADDLNAAIAKMWDELEGPLAKLAEYDAKIQQEFVDARRDLEKIFAAWQLECERRIAEAIQSAEDPDVFNWHRGMVTKLSQELRDSDNHYPDRGLTAGDYTRKGWTAGELDGIGHTVEEMSYKGKFYGRTWNPRLMFSDATGGTVSIRAQIAAAMEAGLDGADTVDVACDTIDWTARTVNERMVA